MKTLPEAVQICGGPVLFGAARLRSRASKPGRKVKITPREITILEHLCRGESSKSTAQLMGLSYRTIETHKQSLRYKTGAHTSVLIALWAVKNGIVKL